ncbi:integral membrane protein [Delphinella strobiligena]|nr:integral membrane protein [Delphinella strobiligena]
MGVGAFIEPFVVLSLLSLGTWLNRTSSSTPLSMRPYHSSKREDSPNGPESGATSPSGEAHNLLKEPASTEHVQSSWRRRDFCFGLKQVWTPDTKVFESRFLSRLLFRFPFLVEVWYWALVYWVYQLGRAFTAVTLLQGTVHTARRHALQLIHLEQKMGIFHERAIQSFFLGFPLLMHWINRIYSFIHIPGTILFLVWLYHHSVVSSRADTLSSSRFDSPTRHSGSSTGPALYQARRRALALSNLIAFIVFSVWPCMPPRLLSDPEYNGSNATEAKSYGFVDTVHGAEGESSVWTQNKFCNQYAAMPSLHFGYSLLVGLTIMTIPLALHRSTGFSLRTGKFRITIPGRRRILAITTGFLYPAIILIAIIATANHFILDAVAGAIVCALAWNANAVLLNLLPLEDWFLWCLRIHKPETEARLEDSSEKWATRRAVSVTRQ